MPNSVLSDADLPEKIIQAAQWIREAEALVISAGAGMGVDSGLPDFRGNEGFWNAYPPFRALGLSFAELASPSWFYNDPALAWGFYGHRLNLYRATAPHAGFGILKTWMAQCPWGGAVFTSNVDGQFQRAGFPVDDVCEAHGSIHHLQEVERADGEIWSADEAVVKVDFATMRALPPFPTHPSSGAAARPNILMFGDAGWNDRRSEEQSRRLTQRLRDFRGRRILVIELGAGTAIPTVRGFSEHLASQSGARLIRINLRESNGPPGTLALSLGALNALNLIAAAVDRGQ